MKTDAKGKAATVTIRRMSLADLKPHPRNPRIHPEPGSPQWEVLKASLKSDYFDPILYNQRNGMLVSGHLRVKVLKEAGFTEADCVVVDYDESTHIARMLAANKLQGEDDMSSIKDLLAELDTGAMDMGLTGYTEQEIEDLLAGKSLGTPELDEEVEILKKRPVIRVLITIPLDKAREVKPMLDSCMAVDEVEVIQDAR